MYRYIQVDYEICFKNGSKLPSSTALLAQAIEKAEDKDGTSLQIRDGRVTVRGKQIDPDNEYPVIVGDYVLNTLMIPELRPRKDSFQIIGKPQLMSELIKQFLKVQNAFPS